MFKIFPCTYTSDGRKVPIAEMKGWYENNLATNNQEIINEWVRLYSHKIKLWGIPTGVTNGVIALDIDVKNQNENGFVTIQQRNYYLPQTLSQTTKSGGKHFIFRYPNDGKRYGNRVKFAPGLDIRGEAGYIVYYGTDNAPLAEAPQWLLDEALKSDDGVDRIVNPENIVKISHEIVQQILSSACENIRNAPEGESNNILNNEAYNVGKLIPSGSLDSQTAYTALLEAATARGKPFREADATIKSGLNGGGKTPFECPFGNSAPELIIPEEEQIINDRWTPPFFRRSDLTAFHKLKQPQLFKDWSTEDIHITTADGGTGKTTLKLYEAICLALGESFLGFDNVSGPGRTLFITGEDRYSKLGAMIGAIMKQMGILNDQEKVDKVLNSVLVKKDTDLRIVERTKEGYIRPSLDALEKLNQAIEDLRPKMIVFDPIASFWGREADLNDMSIAVAKLMGLLVEKSSACVEAINHMGKASSTSKDMSQFAGRGGTGLPSHARVSRVLRPVYDEEFEELTGMELGERSAILCNVNKFSDGSPLYNKPFLILRDGFLFERVTLTEQKVKEQQTKQGDEERIFTYIVEERGQNRFPSKNVIQAHFAHQSDRIPKDRVTRAIDFLQYMGHMGQKLKMIENPDALVGGKAFIIVDAKGEEI